MLADQLKSEPFADGALVHYRTYGPRPNVTAWQVYGRGLEHIAECETQEAANLVTLALNAWLKN